MVLKKHKSQAENQKQHWKTVYIVCSAEKVGELKNASKISPGRNAIMDFDLKKIVTDHRAPRCESAANAPKKQCKPVGWRRHENKPMWNTKRETWNKCYAEHVKWKIDTIDVHQHHNHDHFIPCVAHLACTQPVHAQQCQRLHPRIWRGDTTGQSQTTGRVKEKRKKREKYNDSVKNKMNEEK